MRELTKQSPLSEADRSDGSEEILLLEGFLEEGKALAPRERAFLRGSSSSWVVSGDDGDRRGKRDRTPRLEEFDPGPT